LPLIGPVSPVFGTKRQNETHCFIFMGPCIVRYRGGIYDQQDATNSQYLLLGMLYMFRAIIAHHQELGTVCAAVHTHRPVKKLHHTPKDNKPLHLNFKSARHYTQHYTTTETPCLEYSRLKREPSQLITPYGCTYSSELLMMGNDGPKHVEHF
jgi:hypothetical protein